ncbi:phage tail protein [Acinetobacter variabilis]|uniref:phage tail fiber protein n=1 Tax=Acinetobacter variabilis TaxID=70346 RepID=UPI0021D3CAC9|nr:phage tail protein [Acinetobacter variabilis]MCU4630565.1 phage tail protein [Acinetobacter variabilis]
MAKQTINPGTAPTGAGGDTFRSGSAKLQANDDELYAQLGATAQGVLPAALPINKGGTGGTTAAAARSNLELGNAALATLTASITDTSPGRVMRVGDLGVGVNGGELINIPLAVGEKNIPYRRVAGDSLAAHGLPAGTFALSTFSTSASVGFAVFYPMNVRHDIYVGSLTLNSGSGTTKRFFKLYGEMNTSVDGNGFIKSASPIVQLFADKIELNYEAVQQSITFEKLGTGDYLIKDSSGFAQEGWYIETPKDANGNVLFSVIYTTLENGDISVKTYKKKFDFETVSIVADLDNPVDITENRWIDLRLQELPQPEIEIPESIVPPEFQPTGLAQAVATVMESYDDPEQ